ncbi:hypothetical protein DFH06DRAFT_259338 [Mycena polygramma]|nr:hypothetical protein DFH06DRAFT_259338 [Mycena polygramma]
MSSHSFRTEVHPPVCSVSGIQWNHSPLRTSSPNLYAKVYQDKQEIHRTPTVKRTLAPQWDDIFTIPDNPSAVISIKLFHESRFRDFCLGEALNIQLDDPLNSIAVEASFPLTKLNGKVVGTISLRIEANSISLAHALTESTVMTRDAPPVDDLASVAGAASALTTSAGLRVVVTKLKFVIDMGEKLSQIHPYANAAWKILTAVYELRTSSSRRTRMSVRSWRRWLNYTPLSRMSISWTKRPPV